MRWLKIDYIKQHSRIDYDCEDAILELYGDAAEEMVLNITGRTYEEIVEKYGKEGKPVPSALPPRRRVQVQHPHSHSRCESAA